ncbi:MAG: hypothetical protein AAB606_02070, partial [Patescibacteria group bacterium]
MEEKNKIKIWAIILLATLAVAGGLAALMSKNTGLFKGSAPESVDLSCSKFTRSMDCTDHKYCTWDSQDRTCSLLPGAEDWATDAHDPTINIDSHALSRDIANRYEIKVNGRDDKGLVKVELLVDGTAQGTPAIDSQIFVRAEASTNFKLLVLNLDEPYSGASPNAAQRLFKDHPTLNLYARVTDIVGKTGLSAPVVINPQELARASPTITIVEPAQNSTMFGTEKLKAEVSNDGDQEADDYSPNIVFSSEGGTLIAVETHRDYTGDRTPYEFEIDWNSTELPDGPHNITASILRDGQTIASSSPLEIRVDNTNHGGRAAVPGEVTFNVRDGKEIQGAIDLEATVVEPNLIQGEFTIGENKAPIIRNAGPKYTHRWITTNAPDDTYPIKFEAKNTEKKVVASK